MKKLIILSVFLLVLSASMFAASARVFNQQLVLANEPTNPDDILNYVTNTGTTTSPNYILRVTANGETKGTDLGQAGQNMRVYQNTLSSQLRAIANFNQSLWTVNWVVGSDLVIDIWWTGTPAGQGDGYGAYPEYKHAQKTWVVVAGSVVSQIDANAMIVPPPYVPASDTWTYNLQVNGPAGYAVAGPFPGTIPYLGTTGPLTAEGNTMLGAYTVAAAPAGFHWLVNPIMVAAGDFTGAKVEHTYNATITFALEADPDTYTYNLQVNGPAGYAVTGPFNGTTPYMATDGPALDSVNDLLGVYTIADAPTGFHWVVNPITVVAGDFTGAKVAHVYNATITFVLEANPPVDTYTYNLHVNGPVGYAVTGPVAGVTDYTATDSVVANLVGAYMIAAAPAGFHWAVNPIAVVAGDFVLAKVDYVYNATITFELITDPAGEVITPVDPVTVPPGYPAGNPISAYTVTWSGIHDLFIPRGPSDVLAAALINGVWYAPDGSPDWTWMNVNFDAKVPIWVIIFGPTPFTYLVTSHDVMNPMGPDLNAEILFDTNPSGTPVSFSPPIYAPYTFGAPGNQPFVTGRYAVAKDCWSYWLPESVSFLSIISNYSSDFLGFYICGQTPVELSSFTATLTSDLFVTLTWVSQTESQMSGYLVYRNTTNDQSTSVMIDHPMIPATNSSSTQTYTVVDNDVTVGTTYYYWLEAVDYTSSNFHGPVSVTVEGNVPPVLPEISSMKNAYPNPFNTNSSTSIEVSVKAGENGTVTIYNVLGQVVKTFNVSEGNHMVNWNGKDSRGNACGSGIYFYKLSTPSINQTKKMVIVK